MCGGVGGWELGEGGEHIKDIAMWIVTKEFVFSCTIIIAVLFI